MFQLLDAIVNFYFRSYLLTKGSHSVTEIRINLGNIKNPPGFSYCCLSCRVGLSKPDSGLRFQGVS